MAGAGCFWGARSMSNNEDINDKRDDPDGYKDDETLRNMYWGDGMAVSDIGDHFKQHRNTVTYHMDKHDISRRSDSAAKRVQWDRDSDHKEVTEDFLREEYIQKQQSPRAIADKVGCSKNKIDRRLSEHDIPRRSRSEAARVRNSREPASFRINEDGYVESRTWFDGERYSILIHRLAAVAWFGYDEVAGNVVHHRNGMKRDNREDNFEVMSLQEHSRMHALERES